MARHCLHPLPAAGLASSCPCKQASQPNENPQASTPYEQALRPCSRRPLCMPAAKSGSAHVHKEEIKKKDQGKLMKKSTG